MPHSKVQVNLRLTPAGRTKLEKLSRAWNHSQAQVVELLIDNAEIEDPPQIRPRLSKRSSES